MIRGMHAMFYSSQAEELRAFIRDKLGFSGTDVGGGWLIFDAPEADLGVHPTEGSDPVSGTADVSFYCDDIEATMRELRTRGVEFTQEGRRPRLRLGDILQRAGWIQSSVVSAEVSEVGHGRERSLLVVESPKS